MPIVGFELIRLLFSELYFLWGGIVWHGSFSMRLIQMLFRGQTDGDYFYSGVHLFAKLL
jgi:hypothetical protein